MLSLGLPNYATYATSEKLCEEKCLEISFEHDSKGMIWVWRFRSLASKLQELRTDDRLKRTSSIIDKTTFIKYLLTSILVPNLTAVYNWSDITGPINNLHSSLLFVYFNKMSRYSLDW